MIKRFISLEWKQYFRSSHWQKSIALNILLIFFGIFIAAMFLIVGISTYPIIKKLYPEEDPLTVFNGFLFFWIIGDVMLRFFFQKLPVMSVKPLLTLPIKRSAIVHYVLGKSSVSFFNFLPLFAIVPFGVILISKGHATATILIWMLIIVITSQIINFLNFILENLSSKIELSFLPLLIFAGSLYALDYFNLVSFSTLITQGVEAILATPVYIIIPIAILGILYYLNYKSLYQNLYLDTSLNKKVKEVSSQSLEWTNSFGESAPFMQLDVKLITRNKRSKSTLWMLIMGLLYGLFFYPQPIYADKEFLFVFIGIFSTGIFLINFGQFIPAWDSSYYKLLMSQNIKYENYLKSKFILMVLSVGLLFLLGIPYVYFGWKVLVAHFAAAIYNIGVNSHVILLGGSYNRKRIDLDKKAAFNYQGTGAVQWLIGIPLMLLPMGLFGILNYLFGFEIGISVILLLGISGIAFHQKIMKFITQKYLNSKYKMIDAFSQDN